MMRGPLADSATVDVVVPCYRYAHFLEECVRSVLAQDLPGLRVLVIDDASPDRTPEVASALAASDPRVHHRRHAVNRGHIATYNEGIAWVRAPYMLLLSADDYLLPGALARALKVMAARPDVTLCFGDVVERLPDGTHRPVRPALPRRTDGAPTVLGGAEFVRACVRAGAANIVPTPTAVVATAALRAVGPYRADLPHSADFELWLRLAGRGPVAYLPTPQAVYRRHAGNMSHAYHRDELFTDLQQRRAAFAALLAAGPGGRGPAALVAGLQRGLAGAALAQASTACNHGRPGLARQLRAFAAETHPGVRRTVRWQVVRAKLALGPGVVARLMQWRARLRGAAASPAPERDA